MRLQGALGQGVIVVIQQSLGMLTKSQQVAIGLLSDSMSTLASISRVGMQVMPDEALVAIQALASATGTLAAETVEPLNNFISAQRNIAETMEKFSAVQHDLADVVGLLARQHLAVVGAMEALTGPLNALGHAKPPKA
jgi:hypothetical protein